MALILKANKTFRNPFDGTEITTAYGNIKQVNGNANVPEKYFVFEIYASKQARENGARPIATFSNVVTNNLTENIADYDTFFSEEILKGEGVTDKTQAYEYLKQIKKTDEQGNILKDGDDKPLLLWGDWKSDE